MCVCRMGVVGEGNIPKTVYFITRSMYDWCAVFCYCDLIFGEGGSAIVITKAADGDKRSSGKIRKNVTVLCLRGEGCCERHRHTMCWCQFVAICGKYCGAVTCGCDICACVDVVWAYIMPRCAGVRNGMWLWWDYSR